jgi:hypothetical protein
MGSGFTIQVHCKPSLYDLEPDNELAVDQFAELSTAALVLPSILQTRNDD